MDDKKIKKLRELISKYNYKVLVYAHYPHKNYWQVDFPESKFKESLLLLANERKDYPLMLYVHIPFCNVQCFYCTCHSCLPDSYNEIKNYLEYLYKEFDLMIDFFNKNSIKPNIKEIHIGGGSPTILKKEDFDRLMEKISLLADLKNIREFSIEIDPRFVSKDMMKYYSEKGINRISFGIQDFDLNVQKAINRVQPESIVKKLMTPEIRNYFSQGINFDMLVGLPNQTVESIKKTIEALLKLSPDRVCFSYLGFFPEHAKHQLIMIDGKNGRPARLPDEYERRLIFLAGAEMLINNGYIRTGYDHFAKATDELIDSLKQRKMKWNALGVTTGDYSDTLAIGASSTNTIGNYYSQNLYYKEGYIERIKENKFPVYKGYVLDDDDIKRREVVQSIRNFLRLDYDEMSKRLGIDFKEYFKDEISKLKEFVEDGIISLNGNGFDVTEIGIEFVLYICRIFDKYIMENKKPNFEQQED